MAKFNYEISMADWSTAYDNGMAQAATFREQTNIVIMGAVALFWRNSKNIDYLNKVLAYADAYRGIRSNAVRMFLLHFTGAKYDKDQGKFVGGGKKKAVPAEFKALESWLDWADKEAKEPEFDVKKEAKGVVTSLKRKLEKAAEALADAQEKGDETDILLCTQHRDRTKNALAAVEAIYAGYVVEIESEDDSDDAGDVVPADAAEVVAVQAQA